MVCIGAQTERPQQTHQGKAMFETLVSHQPDTHHVARYTGPERRSEGGTLGSCLTRMLDEIDYGMLLLTSDAQVLFMNHAARLELDGDHPLQLMGRGLRAQRPQDVAPLYDALASAQRGLRKLLTLGEGAHRVSISVVPLPPGQGQRQEDQSPTTLLVLGKRQVCERLSVHGFARSVRLTPAETRVLELLCAGVRPNGIAEQQSVAVSTVRTQIGSIRAKTGAGSIGELLRLVAVLPPMVGALRSEALPGAR
jgi:DNA-binding CsgD family transcriptional regulator